MGFSCRPSCPQVMASNSSSMVPQPPGRAKTQMRSMGWKLSLPEHALEHRVDVAQPAVEIEALRQLLRLEELLHLGVLGEQRAEIAVLVPDLHRVALHDHVRRLPLHALGD